MKFDDILEHHVGEFGPYQKRIYFLVCLPAVAAAFMALMPVFILANPKHRCQIPDMHNDTYEVQSLSHAYLINISIPLEEDVYGDNELSKCLLYDYKNGTVQVPSEDTSIRTCEKWVFDTSQFVTAVTDYGMVCDYEIFQSYFITVTFIGGLLGAFGNGVLSDIIGRKKVFLTCLFIYMLATLVLIFAPNLPLFLAMRFVEGISGSGVFMVSFVYVMELVGPHYRMFAGMFIEIFWCFGLFMLVGAAYVVPYWVHLMVVLCSPCVLFLSYIWLVPESPRWLVSRGRIEEAEKILQKMARINKTTLPDRLVEQVALEETKGDTSNQEAGKFWKLFMHRVVFIRTLIVVFNRFALNMAYYGISLNVDYLSGNLYLNFTLSSVMETIAIIIVLFLINKLGRKPLYCGSMIIGAMGFLLSAIPTYVGSEDDQMYAVGLVMVGKFGVSAGYGVIYVYGSELFPTSIRNSAMGLSLVIDVMGGALSPYIVDIGKLMGGKHGSAFPMLVFGTVSTAAALLSLLLPETRNKTLPETVEDAVKFGQHEVL